VLRKRSPSPLGRSPVLDRVKALRFAPTSLREAPSAALTRPARGAGLEVGDGGRVLRWGLGLRVTSRRSE
jgi:hypothetical protein